MRMTMERNGFRCSQKLWSPALLLGMILNVLPAPGAVGMDSNSGSAPVETVTLDYQEVAYPLLQWSLSIGTRSAHFPKEPTWVSHSVLRGTLWFGGDHTNSMAFIWDRRSGRLALDLNRNQDLTDDAGGEFVSTSRGSKDTATFTNVRLRIPTATGELRLLADLTLWERGDWHGGNGSLRSFWQGKAVLGGSDWQVGIVANPIQYRERDSASAYLLLRPWPARSNAFNISDGSLDAFALPKNLFVGGEAFRLQLTHTTPGADGRPDLQFIRQEPALGELEIAGEFIQRILLAGGPFTAVIDRPAGKVRIPVGDYDQLKVWLKHGDTEACRNRGPNRRITISERQAAMLAAGGPLTNLVTAARHGRSLNLGYRLIGAGGDEYVLMQQDRSQPPEFVVYRGDRKLVSGKFAYG
jgi:hypothetical protein